MRGRTMRAGYPIRSAAGRLLVACAAVPVDPPCRGAYTGAVRHQFLLTPLAAVAVILAGCDTSETIYNCTYGANPGTGQCNPAPATTGGGTADGGATTGGAGDDAGASTTGGGARSTGGGTTSTGGGTAATGGDTGGSGTGAAEDAGTTAEPLQDVGPPAPKDTFQPPKCTPNDDPTKLRIGMPCSADDQCQTCLCYGESYLSPFRFCTKDCQSGTGSGCPQGEGPFPEYTCLRFTHKLITDYELTIEALCMPLCQNVEECAIYAPDYNVCESPKWDGDTVAASKVCGIK